MNQNARYVPVVAAATVLILTIGCLDSADMQSGPGDREVAGAPSDERQLEIKLPRIEEARPPQRPARDVYINVDLDGNIFVGDEPMSVGELEDHLAVLVAEDAGQQSAVIRADGRCLLRDVVEIMAVCHRQGVSHSLAVRTETEEESPADPPSPVD